MKTVPHDRRTAPIEDRVAPHTRPVTGSTNQHPPRFGGRPRHPRRARRCRFVGCERPRSSGAVDVGPDIIGDVTSSAIDHVAARRDPLAGRTGKGRTERKRTGNTGQQRSLPVNSGHSKTSSDLASRAVSRHDAADRLTVRFPPAPPTHLTYIYQGLCRS